MESKDAEFSDLKTTVFVSHPSNSETLWSNSMFIAQVLEFFYSLAMLIVASLIVASEVAINHYYFLTVTLIMWFCLVLTHSISIIQWEQKVPFSHPHNNAIFFGFFSWMTITLTSEILLGIWLFKKDDSSWDFEDNQPDMSPFSSEYTRLLLVYTFWAIGNLVAMTFTAAALIAHYYPETNFVLPSVLSATIYKHD